MKMVKREGGHRVWDEGTVAELLACWDYCIDHDNIDFEILIHSHMQRVTGIDINVKRAVNPRLGKLRQKYGFGAVTLANFSQQGSSCLPGLTPEMMLKIERAKSHIDAYLSQSPVSTSGLQKLHLSDENKQALAQSKPDENAPNVDRKLPTKLPRAEIGDTKASQGRKEKRQKHSHDGDQVYEIPSSPSSSPSPSQSIISRGSDNPVESRITPMPPDQTRHQHPPEAQSTQIQGSSSNTAEEVDDLLAVIETLQDPSIPQGAHAEQDVSLSDEYAKLKEEHNELLKKHEQINTRYRELKEFSRSENASLKKIIEDQRRLRDHNTKVGAHCYGLNVGEIWEKAAWLDDQIGKACLTLSKSHCRSADTNDESTWDTSFQPILGRIMGVGELNTIKSSVGGREIPELETLKKFVEFRQLSRQDVLRSLVSAYFCSSVFETSFPVVFSVEMSLQDLLEKYRRYVLIQDGPIALRSMDVLAHEAWMTEPRFAEDTILQKSQDLATRLGTFLTPVLLSNIFDEEMHDFEMFPELSAEDSFQPVFAYALQLKTQLLLDDKQYRLEFYPPGTPFNQKTMKRHGYSGRAENDMVNPLAASSTGREIDGGQVKICLFPAVWTYYEPPSPPSGHLDISTSVRRHAVNYDTFIKDHDEAKGYHQLLAKAIVSLSSS